MEVLWWWRCLCWCLELSWIQISEEGVDVPRWIHLRLTNCFEVIKRVAWIHKPIQRAWIQYSSYNDCSGWCCCPLLQLQEGISWGGPCRKCIARLYGGWSFTKYSWLIRNPSWNQVWFGRIEKSNSRNSWWCKEHDSNWCLTISDERPQNSWAHWLQQILSNRS